MMVVIWSFTAATAASAARPRARISLQGARRARIQMGGRQERDARAAALHGRSGLRQRNRDQIDEPERFAARSKMDLVHNKPGKQKYRATANADQTLEYCAIFNDVVLQCYTLTPDVIPLYWRGGTIYGPFSKTEAEVLTHQIRRTLRANAATAISGSTSPPTPTPWGHLAPRSRRSRRYRSSLRS